jgi:DeoR/GlpR family transcriptional regulator of sugar metabolism
MKRPKKSDLHGTNACYGSGCRCDKCKQGHAAYVRRLRRSRLHTVSAQTARRHIKKLSRRGVGRRAVAAAADLNEHTVFEIRRGTRKRIHGKTEQRILSTTTEAIEDNALIDSRKTKYLLAHLLKPEVGFTKKELARRLGSRAKVPMLQLVHPRVRARNAMKVEKFYKWIVEDV